jgi:hypothetical protein
MRAWLALFIAFLLTLTARADPPASAPAITICARPGGATATEATAQGRRGLPALAGDGYRDQSIDTFAWNADPTTAHHIVLRRPPFEDIYFDLQWDARSNHWMILLPARKPRRLVSGYTFDFSRKVGLRFFPSDATVFVDEGSLEDAAAASYVIDIDGVTHALTPLPHEADRWIVPHAANPPPLWLIRPRFRPTRLQLSAAELASDATILPAQPLRLAALYGPFSYAGFDAVLLFGVTSGVWWWAMIMAPRQRRNQRLRQRELETRQALAVAADDALKGSRLTTSQGETFVLLEWLGRGGMSSVYEGMSLSPDRAATERVAVKLLKPLTTDEERERFTREVKICCSLHHPAIVQLLDWGFFETPQAGSNTPVPYLIMEKVEGMTLRDWIEQWPAREAPRERLLGIFTDVLRALRVAHGARILHRDIKPDNIMVLESERAKLLDFGIAHLMTDPHLTAPGFAIGTPQYMSPEHLEGDELTPASDLYSLGIVLFEALMGQRPYADVTHGSPHRDDRREDRRENRRDAHGDEPEDELPNLLAFDPTLDPALAQVLGRMLMREPGHRCQSADEVLEQLPRITLPHRSEGQPT